MDSHVNNGSPGVLNGERLEFDGLILPLYDLKKSDGPKVNVLKAKQNTQ